MPPDRVPGLWRAGLRQAARLHRRAVRARAHRRLRSVPPLHQDDRPHEGRPRGAVRRRHRERLARSLGARAGLYADQANVWGSEGLVTSNRELQDAQIPGHVVGVGCGKRIPTSKIARCSPSSPSLGRLCGSRGSCFGRTSSSRTRVSADVWLSGWGAAAPGCGNLPPWHPPSTTSPTSPSPALLVYPDRVEQNIRRMIEIARRRRAACGRT